MNSAQRESLKHLFQPADNRIALGVLACGAETQNRPVPGKRSAHTRELPCGLEGAARFGE
jgi:hypothetical protein